MKKFFYAENATRNLAGQKFEIVDIHAGTAIGVFATDDAPIISQLSELPGVSLITQAEYESLLKKKQPKYEPLNSLPQSVQGMAILKGQHPAIVVENPQPQPVQVVVGTVTSIEDALKLEPVAEATESPAVQSKPGRKGSGPK